MAFMSPIWGSRNMRSVNRRNPGANCPNGRKDNLGYSQASHNRLINYELVRPNRASGTMSVRRASSFRGPTFAKGQTSAHQGGSTNAFGLEIGEEYEETRHTDCRALRIGA